MRQEEIKKLILERGCYSPEENLRIFNKFFGRMPLNLIIPLKRYKLNEKKVLDLGCTYGNYLIYFGPGSQGVDIDERAISFGRSIGLDIVKSNLDKELAVQDNFFDAAWCSNFLEHVESPHLFLRRIHTKLVTNGLIFIKVPLIPNSIFNIFYKLVFGNPGYGASEHLYAYTKRSIEFIIERTGFKMIESNVFLPHWPLLNQLSNPILSRLGPTITVVARKIDNFKYPEKRPCAY